MLRGKGGDLPHAVYVQKWRVDEAEVVVCYHGNIEKQGRCQQEKTSIHRHIIIPSACFSVVITEEFLHTRTVPKLIVKSTN